MALIVRILALARELRDTIYTHLWTADGDRDPVRDLVYWWDTFLEPYFLPDSDVRQTPWTTSATGLLRPPHFTDQGIVGPQFALEVLKRFKDTVGKDLRPTGERNPVAVCTIVDGLLHDFVTKDIFNMGMTVEELVRNCDLRIIIQCDILDDNVHVARKKYLSQLLTSVTALLGVPYTEHITTHNGTAKRIESRPRTVTLAISQESDFAEREHFISILKVVAHAYHGLREKGFTVNVEYYSEEAGLKVLFEDDVWEWTDEDWAVNVTRRNELVLGTREYRDAVWRDIRENLFKVA
jgi:hypothetical protein